MLPVFLYTLRGDTRPGYISGVGAGESDGIGWKEDRGRG